jgi:hypothetical protein
VDVTQLVLVTEGDWLTVPEMVRVADALAASEAVCDTDVDTHTERDGDTESVTDKHMLELADGVAP